MDRASILKRFPQWLNSPFSVHALHYQHIKGWACDPCFYPSSFNLQQPEKEHYVEDDFDAGPSSEQKRWEEDHLNAALLKFGAKDAKRKQKVGLSDRPLKKVISRLIITSLPELGLH